jgi:hypothetical protein
MDGALRVIDFFEIGFGIGSWSLVSTDDLLSKVFLKKNWGDRHGFKFVMSFESRVDSLKLPNFGKLSFDFDGIALQWRSTSPTSSSRLIACSRPIGPTPPT